MNKIIITTRRIGGDTPPEVVRLSEDAGIVVRAIQRRTGLSARDVVSQIITQAADIIEYREEP